jgi:hypothetical protein
MSIIMLKILIFILLIFTVISLFYAFFHLIKNPQPKDQVIKPLIFRVIASFAVLALAYLQLSGQF